jgi:hypothetical protein
MTESGDIDEQSASASLAARSGRIGWLASPILQPVGLLSGPAVRLFLTSTVVLFVELLLIRWVPANVTFVGFFRNFLLMASFLGIGAGILFGRDDRRIPLSPFALTLAATVALVGTATLEISVKSDQEIFFGLTESQGPAVEFLVLGVLIVLVSIIMASLSLPLGRLLTSMPPLRAYAVDIAGSMTGIAAFTILSGLETPPQVWFTVVAIVLGLLALGSGGDPVGHAGRRRPRGGDCPIDPPATAWHLVVAVLPGLRAS